MKVSSGMKQNYSNLGYDFSQDYVYIKIEHLKKSSQQKLEVICDLCNNNYIISFAKYNINMKRNGFYSCKKCALEKRTEKFKNNNLSLNSYYQKKKKETFIRNYGVDNPSKSEYIKEKKKNTLLENYGVNYTSEVNKLQKEGMIRKYNVSHPSQSEEIKSRMKTKLIDNYGVDNVSKLDFIKDKKKETCFRNYGVYSPSQSTIIFKKQLSSAYKIIYYNDELFSQGSYELDFLNYCENNSIIDLISNGPSIEYILESNNSNHTYHSDFFIEKINLIIEIKSSYTYNIDLDKNLMKRKYSKLNGYNFIFIIDKDYTEFENIINNLK